MSSSDDQLKRFKRFLIDDMIEGTIDLPPILASTKEGEISWKSATVTDARTVGYLLTCHLVIENYLDRVIEHLADTKLNWREARLTFSQKVALLSTVVFEDERYNFLPAIKHLNKLRNRLAHNLDASIALADLAPLAAALKADEEGKPKVLDDMRIVLWRFTGVVCAFYAGLLAGQVHRMHVRRSRGSAGGVVPTETSETTARPQKADSVQDGHIGQQQADRAGRQRSDTDAPE